MMMIVEAIRSKQCFSSRE